MRLQLERMESELHLGHEQNSQLTGRLHKAEREVNSLSCQVRRSLTCFTNCDVISRVITKHSVGFNARLSERVKIWVLFTSMFLVFTVLLHHILKSVSCPELCLKSSQTWLNRTSHYLQMLCEKKCCFFLVLRLIA